MASPQLTQMFTAHPDGAYCSVYPAFPHADQSAFCSLFGQIRWRPQMPIFKVEGVKGDHRISEHASSETKAGWVAAFYVEAGYKVTITEVTPLTGSLEV